MKISPQNLDSLAVGAGIGLVGRLAGRILIILESLLAARILGPTMFGLYAIGLTVFRLIELIAPLGFDHGLINSGAADLLMGNRQALKGKIIRSLIISFGFSVLLAIVLFWFSPWIASQIFRQQALTTVFRVFAPAIPLSGLLAILAAVSRMFHRMEYSVIVQDLGQPLLALGILFVFLFVGLKIEHVILADQLSYLFSVLLASYFLKTLFPYVFDKTEVIQAPNRAYYSFSFSSSIAIFISTLVLWVDRLFAGAYLSPSEVGVYQAALQLSVIFAIIMSSLSRILFPMFSTLYFEGKLDELGEVFRIGTKWSFYVGLPIALFMFMNPGPVLALMYGDVYSSGGRVLTVLLIGQFFNLVTGAVGPLLLAGGHYRMVVLLSAIILVINALLCVILIPNIGIVGAALSNSISLGLLYIIALLIVRTKMKLWPYDLRYLKGVASIGCAGACAYASKLLLVDSSVVSLAIQFVIIILVFALSLLALGLPQEDRVFIVTALRRIGIRLEDI